MSVGKISSVLTFKTKHMAYLFAVAVKYIFNDFFFLFQNLVAFFSMTLRDTYTLTCIFLITCGKSSLSIKNIPAS